MKDGIPSIDDYKSLIRSRAFKDMEAFSEDFLEANAPYLIEYSKHWAKDPIHQWSRQWEYPYVLDKIQEHPNPEMKVLDAGCGVTFFSYYLKSLVPGADIYCLDYDQSLAEIYKNINASYGKEVSFLCESIQKTSFEDESFDVIYTISVLEHTENYPAVIEEFYRILKPGGKLIVTFDISQDGTRDISIDESIKLLDTLTAIFSELQESRTKDFAVLAQSSDIFTTNAAGEIDMQLLPWKAPSLIGRLRNRLRGDNSWPPLTFYCLTLTKNEAA